MRCFIFILQILLIHSSWTLGTSSSTSSNSQQQNSLTFSESVSKFAIQFYEAIIANNPGSIVMSAFSAQTVLSLLYCGASGQTETIMAQSLGFVDNQNAVANQYQSILQPLQNNPNLTIANAIYLMKNYAIQQNYLAIAQNQFFSTISSIDFSNNNQAASIMNNWVAQETHNKITNLISPDALSSTTRLVLLNAIYFTGLWKTQFDVSDTNTMPFYVNGSKTMKNVQMMHLTAKFNYNFIANLNSQVIELPFKKNNISMVLILPKNCNGLSQLQQSLMNFDFTTLDCQSTYQTVQLSIPKFTIETTLNLNTPLTTLGMGNIFSDNANFSKILIPKNCIVEILKVTDVVQKAYIEVNEMGATAAAATGVIVGTTAVLVPPPSPIFNADHPFIFVLKNNENVLFMGNYNG